MCVSCSVKVCTCACVLRCEHVAATIVLHALDGLYALIVELLTIMRDFMVY